MYLALHLGCPSPFKMLRGMSAFELSCWQHYYAKTKFGSTRAEHQVAMTAATQVSVHTKKGHRMDPNAFIVKDEWPQSMKMRVDWQDMRAKFMGLTGAK